MSPTQIMIVSGLITAIAATTTLVSGAVFKRAFDQYHQSKKVEASAKLVEDVPTPVTPRAPKTSPTAKVQIGKVQSVNQKGGVTAGYVESVKQGPSE
jgi:hypothetical protein